MSAIASTYSVPRADLARWQECTISSYDELRDAAHELATFGWSGWVLTTLLPVLQGQYGIDIFQSGTALANHLNTVSGAFHAVWNGMERGALIARLDPALFKPDELRAAYEEYNAITVPEAGQFMTAGIAFLRAALEATPPDSALLLIVY